MILHHPLKTCGPRFLVFLVAFVSFIVAPGESQAQEPQADDVLKVTTDLLLFPIRVKDKHGQLASGLTEKDLSLKDEDQVTAGIYLSRGADRVALLFALDQSGSVREVITQQRNAALGLFDRFGEDSSVAVLRFAATPKLIAAFGRDMATARSAFIFPENSNQPTAIFDAASAAVSAFQMLPRVRAERRIIILISDGLDNASKTKPDAVINTARAARVSFYVIHLPLFTPVDGRLAVRPASKGFRDLAEKTGGKYFLARDHRSALNRAADIELNPIFQAIEEDLKSQYLLGFYLNEKANDGRRHEFSLTLPDGYEYYIGERGFARTHKFHVTKPQMLKTR